MKPKFLLCVLLYTLPAALLNCWGLYQRAAHGDFSGWSLVAVYFTACSIVATVWLLREGRLERTAPAAGGTPVPAARQPSGAEALAGLFNQMDEKGAQRMAGLFNQMAGTPRPRDRKDSGQA